MRSLVTLCVLFTTATLFGQTLKPPVVSVVGADQTGVKITLPNASAALNLPIETTTAVKAFHVTVDAFRGPDSKIVPVFATLNGQPADEPFDLGQSDRPLLTITGVFQAAGDYKSNIVIFSDQGRQPSIPLTITRQMNALSVQLDLVNAVSVTLPISGTTDVPIRFSLRETSGLSLNLFKPALIGLAVKDSDKTAKQAAYNAIELANATQSLAVLPQQSFESTLVVKGLGTPGEYAAVLRVSSPDTTPAEMPVSLFVKDNGFIAGLFIFLGVVSSWLIRYWTKEQRPRLAALRNVANTIDDLDTVERSAGPPSGVAKGIFDGLRASIATIERNLNQKNGVDETAALTDIATKIARLPNWLTLENQIRAVDPPSIVGSALSNWEALGNGYFLLSSIKPDEFDTQLKAIKANVDASVTAATIREIGDLKAAVGVYGTAHPTSDFDAVQKSLDSALQLATDGKRTEALQNFKDAQASYAREVAKGLLTILSGQRAIGFTQETWVQLGSTIGAQIRAVTNEPDPSKAIKLFGDTNKAYTQAAVSALLSALPEKRAALTANGNVAPDVKVKLTADLNSAEDALKAAQISLNSGNVDEAFDLYVKSEATVMQTDDKLAKTGANTLGARDVFTRLIGIIGYLPKPLVLETAKEVPAVPKRASYADRLSEIIGRYDMLFNIGILVIATVFGLKLLWVDNAVWGGWKDFTIAFLWGLGLQQVGGTGLDGLPAITRKLTDQSNAAN